MESTTVCQPDKQPQLPHFLAKLWSILDDPQYETAICWDKSGESFHIVDSYLFKNAVLPRYFKHNNLNSFVRQLNLYGFRKIPTVGSLMNENGDNLHFSHPLFVKGNFHLLQHIKRNAVKGTGNAKSKQDQSKDKTQVTLPEDDLICLLQELKLVRDRQNGMKNTITQLTRDNILLWQEMAALRNAQNKQQENVSKLVKFLMALVQSQKRVPHSAQRIMQLDEVDEAVHRPNPANRPFSSQGQLSCLPLQRGGQAMRQLDFGILDGIQQDLRESFNMGSTLSVNAENALLEGLQLRQRAIEEGGPYLEDGILQPADDGESPSSSLGSVASTRAQQSALASVERYRGTVENGKRTFKQCFPSYSNMVLAPKKSLHEPESPTLESAPSSSRVFSDDPEYSQHLQSADSHETYYFVDEQGNPCDFGMDMNEMPEGAEMFLEEGVLHHSTDEEHTDT